MIQSDSPGAVWATTVHDVHLMLVEDVLQVEAQGITCYSSTAFTLYSVIAQALIELGGPSIRAEAAKYQGVRIGDVIALPGGKLKSNYVLAAVTNKPRDTPTLGNIADCVAELLRRAAGLGLESLAIPLLLAGRQLEFEDILRATLAPIIDHACGPTSLRQVYIGLQGHLNPFSAQRLTRYIDDTAIDLVALGELRVRIDGLQEIRRRLTLFEQRSSRLRMMLLKAELGLLRQTRAMLEDRRPLSRQGLAGLNLELRLCDERSGSVERELGQVERTSNLEQAVGA